MTRFEEGLCEVLLRKVREDSQFREALSRALLGGERDADLLTVREGAAHARVHPETLRRWIRTGVVAGVGQGKRLRVRRADVERALTKGRRRGTRLSAEQLAELADEEDRR